jgi:hypothetical protein
MDADLAFCLECFADEQMAKNIEQIAQPERRLEIKSYKFEGILKYDDVTASRRENSLVEKFSFDLKEKEISIAKTRKIIETEFRKALDRTVADIDTIAQIAPTTKTNRQIEEALRAASNQIRRQVGQIDNELAHLTNAIDFTISSNYSTRIMTWLKQHYGYVAELGRMVGQNSGFIDQLAFSEKGSFVQCVLEPARIWDDRRRLISDFVEQFGEDETTSSHLNDSLSRMKSIDNALDLIHSYLQNRKAERCQQQEELLRKMELELEQKRADQQTRALEMASAIYQLSVGSTNASQFDKKLKQVLNRSRISEQFIPFLIGHVEEASGRRTN